MRRIVTSQLTPVEYLTVFGLDDEEIQSIATVFGRSVGIRRSSSVGMPAISEVLRWGLAVLPWSRLLFKGSAPSMYQEEIVGVREIMLLCLDDFYLQLEEEWSGEPSIGTVRKLLSAEPDAVKARRVESRTWHAVLAAERQRGLQHPVELCEDAVEERMSDEAYPEDLRFWCACTAAAGAAAAQSAREDCRKIAFQVGSQARLVPLWFLSAARSDANRGEGARVLCLGVLQAVAAWLQCWSKPALRFN